MSGHRAAPVSRRYERASWWQSTGKRWLVTAAGVLLFFWVWVLIDPAVSLLVVVPATIAGRSPRVRAWALRQLSAARARARRSERESAAAAERGECVSIGRSIWYGGPVVLAHRALDEHVFVAGASGAGKTTTALRLLLGRLRAGRGVASIDLKGDLDTTAGMRALDADGQVFDLRDSDGPSFDPLRYGDPVGWASMLAHLTEWSEDHYRLSAQDFLAQLLGALSARAERFDLDQVLGYMAKPGRARELARELRKRGERGERQARGIEAALDRIEDDRSIRSGISGMAARLSTVVYSPNVGYRIGPDSGSGEVDIGHALYEGGVAHFSLAEPRYGDEAATLAALVAGAVNAAASTERGDMDLAIDEAHVLGGRRVVSLIRMARSAGVGVLVATQDVFDFADHTEAIWGSCAVKVAHRQEGRAAQYVADQAGTYTTCKLTEKWEDGGLLRGPVSSGEMSVREVEEYRAHPNLIRELGRGEAVLIERAPESRVDLVAVEAPRPAHGSGRRPGEAGSGHAAARPP